MDIRRIERTLARYGARFEARVFAPEERAKAERRGAAGPRAKAATLAKRFAAKEACAKALGTGFRSGVYWRDMVIVNDACGKPTLSLAGGAAKRLAAITPTGMEARIDVTLSDDYPLAQAIVLISLVPSASAMVPGAPPAAP